MTLDAFRHIAPLIVLVCIPAILALTIVEMVRRHYADKRDRG